jgi:hypothetical protein
MSSCQHRDDGRGRCIDCSGFIGPPTPNSDQQARRSACIAARRALLDRIASMPLPAEPLRSTWCPPDWEDIVDWYDEFVREARKLTGKSYR